jgi:hypothetical protein
MPRSRSETVSASQSASKPPQPKAPGAAVAAKSAARATPRKAAAHADKTPRRTAPVTQAQKVAEAPRVIMPAAPPPAPPQPVRQALAVLIVLARLLVRLGTQLWARLSTFLHGPGRAAAKAALKAATILRAKMWDQLKIAYRRAQPEPGLHLRGETPGDFLEDALPAFPPNGRIPPHQRHLYAHLNNC